MKFRNAMKGILTGVLLAAVFVAGFDGISSGESFASEPAIRGYDAVSYFTAGKAVKGDGSYDYAWHDMTWYFSSKRNRDLFAADPGKYAPQYDGYCAWAMTESRKARTDPEVWKIVGGKLYLNCSRSAYEKWSRDIPGNIRKADANWQKLNKPSAK
jgi:YHS domain-containing protein